ncbi:hypothetical protein RvY_12478 [Ramazzottius varieornatus]|uniref:Uncharacterized protein n=1 Tax=Ramazzottius varieornatus TaxID=947166 RepID=A0A1D1VJM7_RAMVA|nr:hypothetical protein RvY_12478 [Ramazzottius varieornatus]
MDSLLETFRAKFPDHIKCSTQSYMNAWSSTNTNALNAMVGNVLLHCTAIPNSLHHISERFQANGRLKRCFKVGKRKEEVVRCVSLPRSLDDDYKNEEEERTKLFLDPEVLTKDHTDQLGYEQLATMYFGCVALIAESLRDVLDNHKDPRWSTFLHSVSPCFAELALGLVPLMDRRGSMTVYWKRKPPPSLLINLSPLLQQDLEVIILQVRDFSPIRATDHCWRPYRKQSL